MRGEIHEKQTTNKHRVLNKNTKWQSLKLDTHTHIYRNNYINCTSQFTYHLLYILILNYRIKWYLNCNNNLLKYIKILLYTVYFFRLFYENVGKK